MAFHMSSDIWKHMTPVQSFLSCCNKMNSALESCTFIWRDEALLLYSSPIVIDCLWGKLWLHTLLKFNLDTHYCRQLFFFFTDVSYQAFLIDAHCRNAQAITNSRQTTTENMSINLKATEEDSPPRFTGGRGNLGWTETHEQELSWHKDISIIDQCLVRIAKVNLGVQLVPGRVRVETWLSTRSVDLFLMATIFHAVAKKHLVASTIQSQHWQPSTPHLVSSGRWKTWNTHILEVLR